ncbi:hypothetical protein UFOVP1454_21 [uncultured Caudovirales phage]|uniref:Uncharacterized protein n=1 Tax=uncultured Caudovirales phage TaxID=2100421 RepID=A0A6J5SIM7_9CAUD|nr:hypothetical protein UFOVP1454_21 [uncultured Caudovirales phage]
MTDKACSFCNKMFKVGKQWNYCSAECREEGRKINQAKHIAKNVIGLQHRFCKNCDRGFETTLRSLCCSPLCTKIYNREKEYRSRRSLKMERRRDETGKMISRRKVYTQTEKENGAWLDYS